MITLGLGLSLLVGLVTGSALHVSLEHPAPGVRRLFYAHFPVSVGLGVAGVTGLVARLIPGVCPVVAVAVAVVSGHLFYRVVDHALNGRPRVFSSDEVVVVPAHWH